MANKFAKAIISSLAAVFFGQPAHAQETLARCESPAGFANYHFTGIVPKKSSGFHEDKISNAAFSLVQFGNDAFDIRFVDATRKIISANEDGGTVVEMRRGKRDSTFAVIYPGSTIEIYTFYQDASGARLFDLMQSKGGDDLPIHKSSVMTGACSEFSPKLFATK